MTPEITYALAGVVLLGGGLSGLFFCAHLLRKILAVNLAGSGVFLVLVALARRHPAGAPEAALPEAMSPDAVPHALVLTGIVVSVSATAVALALYRRLGGVADDRQPTEGPPGSNVHV